MSVTQMRELIKKKISYTIPVMIIWKALTKRKLKLEKELWKDKGKFYFISNNCSVINQKHTMAKIVSARQWLICL